MFHHGEFYLSIVAPESQAPIKSNKRRQLSVICRYWHVVKLNQWKCATIHCVWLRFACLAWLRRELIRDVITVENLLSKRIMFQLAYCRCSVLLPLRRFVLYHYYERDRVFTFFVAM